VDSCWPLVWLAILLVWIALYFMTPYNNILSFVPKKKLTIQIDYNGVKLAICINKRLIRFGFQ
jgi:hypothetical protein